jgi:antitoxin component YwqK of YwqJK toxin-antitoxin module
MGESLGKLKENGEGEISYSFENGNLQQYWRFIFNISDE